MRSVLAIPFLLVGGLWMEIGERIMGGPTEEFSYVSRTSLDPTLDP